MANRDRRFRWLVRLLPPSFREEHEREILTVWRDETRQADERRMRQVWLDALRDTLRVAPKEHALAFLRNMNLAARRLRRTPAFTLTAVLTLAFGTGATAAVFTLVNAVLLRPLPWSAPERVGLVWAMQPSGERTWLSVPELEGLQRDADHLTGTSGLTDLRPRYEHEGIGEEVQALAISHGFFAMLGVQPVLGRDFTRDDDRTGAAPVVLLSDAFWRSALGADAGIVGRTLKLNETEYAIVGVLPASFALLPASTVLPDRVDVWLPLAPHLISRERSVRFLHALARLGPNVTFSQADQALRSYGAQVSRGLPAAYPGGTWTFSIVSFTDDVLKNARPALYLLFGLVVLVLIMACSNVANLLLARGEARRTELAVRTALGAGPARLAGELLAESFLLAVAGSVSGLALAASVPRLLRAIDPAALPRLADAGVDVRVALFMAGLILLTLVTFAAVPLVERMRLRSLSPLLAGRSGGRTQRGARVARGLAIAQAALATMILVTTLFLYDVFMQLQRTDLGFSPQHVLSGRVSLSAKYPNGPGAVRFFASTIEALDATPGVTAAAAITQLPLSGAMLGSSFLVTPAPEPRRIDADLRGITPGYFAVMGTPIISGRYFTDRDLADSPGVVVVDEAFANRLSADGNVLGKRVRWFRQPDADLEIVGVVRAVRHRGPDQPIRETVYRPHSQYPRNSMFLVVRANPDAPVSTDTVRRALARIDPSQPFADTFTMDERLGRAVTRARTSLLLAGALAVLAMGLGGGGLYGVLSVGVAQRRREFGVRLSLGATPRSVRALVLREGLILIGAGAALGIPGSIVIVTVLRAAIYDAHTANLPLYAAGVLLLFVLSSVSLWIPARRASGVNPIDILRAD